MKMALLLSFLISVVVHTANARPLTVEEKLADLQQLSSTIRANYGPLKYKNEVFKLSVDDLEKAYSEKVKQTKTNGAFYYLMVRFVAEFKDSHFSLRLPTTHRSKLGFSTDLIQGKVLIDVIDRTVLPESEFPYQKGDEIVKFDGEPTADVVARLETHYGMGNQEAAKRLAAMALSNRAGSVFPVKSGEVTLEIRKGQTEVIDTVKTKWFLSGKPMDELDKSNRKLKATDYDQLSVTYLLNDLSNEKTEQAFRCSGNTRTEIPKDATILMTKPFVAYYHPTDKGNVGYLRIPQYTAANDSGVSEYDLRFAQYEYMISILEEKTVGLVIDQDHNCGGSVDYLQRMVSLFAKSPFKPLQFTFLGTKSESLMFNKWLTETSTASGTDTLEYQLFSKVVNMVNAAWEKGDFMTSMTSFSGEETVAPHSIRYSKPIVMLVDELSGSGGDAFPAVMQGIKRATLIGNRTMGAGGHVQEQPSLFNSGLTVRMTKSLFYRPDGVAVENNAVSPDVQYLPTREDFLNGYREYQKFYLNELAKQL